MDRKLINARRAAAQIVIAQGYWQDILEPVECDGGEVYSIRLRSLVSPMTIEAIGEFYTDRNDADGLHVLKLVSDLNAQCEIDIAGAVSDGIENGGSPRYRQMAAVLHAALVEAGHVGLDVDGALQAQREFGLSPVSAVHLLRYTALKIGGFDPTDPELATAVTSQCERIALNVETRLRRHTLRRALERVTKHLVVEGQIDATEVQELLSDVQWPKRPFGLPTDYGWPLLQSRARLPLDTA